MQGRVSEHTFDIQTVRAGPSDDTEQVTQVLPGEPVTVEEVRDGWARVRTAYDYPGWIRADALGGDPDPEWKRQRVVDPIEYARSLLGARYEWGGMTHRGIDCSGLVHMSFRASGRVVPRDADKQEAAGTPVSAADLRPGDLISYGDADGADHIAFWLGGGRILHSTQREDVDGVVEEEEPEHLRARRRCWFRL
jgi:cell wall-associated NlpC family hydrolase